MREDPKFGTDGVRGLANDDLSADFAFRLGRTAGFVIGASRGGGGVLIGRDTRISGDMLRCALTAGLLSVGAHAIEHGILPTAGVAFLTEQTRATAGAMISASHNPAPDNGIKFFGSDGRKMADETETEIEQLVHDPDACPTPTGDGVGRLLPAGDLLEQYVSHLLASAPAPVSGLRVLVDCANGAAYELAPRVLR